MKKTTVAFAALLLGLLVAGCVQLSQTALTPLPQPIKPTPTPLPTAPPITPIAPAAEPAWLAILYPKPGQVVLLKEYLSSHHPSHSGSMPAPNVPAAICIEVWVGDLLEAGDYWGVYSVMERTIVIVDGVQRQFSEDNWYDGIVLTSKLDGEGNVVAEAGGPYAYCFLAPLGVGTHQVDLSFQKSSGMTPVFSWTFEIVQDAIPTSTPLPTPSVIDSQGNLPDYLRAVYPQPGEQLNTEQASIEPEDNEVGWYFWKNQQNICFALRTSALYELGSLPSSTRDWPDRIYFQVDGQLQPNWSSNESWAPENDLDYIISYCVPVLLPPGEHVATIYIHPFDGDLVSYSWSFTLIE